MNYYKQYRPNQKSIPDVILHLLILNGLVYLAQNLLPQYNNAIVGHYFLSPEFKPWQIISHMFAHANNWHILFNMFNLWMFGRILANVWDNKRFLFLYFTAGLVAFLCHQLYLFSQFGWSPDDSIMLGASGAVYGVLVAFATLFPNTKLFLLFIPVPIKAKYLIGVFVLMDAYYGFSGATTGIAHFAHLGGAITGFLLVKFWQNNNNSFY